MHVRILFFLILVSGFVPTVRAQKIEFGGGFGGMNYKGDISPALQPKLMKPGGHLFFRYNANKAVSGRFSLTGGRIFGSDIKSSDPFQQKRGVIFGTRIIEAGADIQYNFLDFNYARRRPRNWSPYLFAGLAVFTFKPDQEKVEPYKTTGIAIPFGAGIKWQVKGPWSVGVEFGTRKTFTDYLDNYNAHGAGIPKNYQSDPTRKDMYYYSSLSVSYTILKIACPD